MSALAFKPRRFSCPNHLSISTSPTNFSSSHPSRVNHFSTPPDFTLVPGPGPQEPRSISLPECCQVRAGGTHADGMEVGSAKGLSAVSLASTFRVSFSDTISGQTCLLCICYRRQRCTSKILRSACVGLCANLRQFRYSATKVHTEIVGHRALENGSLMQCFKEMKCNLPYP